MKNSSYSKARVLTLAPLIVLAATVICMVLASILAVPTNKGVLYTIFGSAGLMSMFLSPFPCLVISVIGTVFAAKAAKEGTAQARIFLILGIIEVLVCAAGAVLAIMMFMVGMGV